MATPPTPAPRTAPAAPPSAPRPGRPISLREFYDIHLVVGIRDEKIRIRRKDWVKLQVNWMILKEDVVLCLHGDKHEYNIVLRGSEGGTLRLTESQPAQKMPVASVMTIPEMKELMWKAQMRQAEQPGN